jgi:hypothetical protein
MLEIRKEVNEMKALTSRRVLTRIGNIRHYAIACHNFPAYLERIDKEMPTLWTNKDLRMQVGMHHRPLGT